MLKEAHVWQFEEDLCIMCSEFKDVHADAPMCVVCSAQVRFHMCRQRELPHIWRATVVDKDSAKLVAVCVCGSKPCRQVQEEFAQVRRPGFAIAN